MANVSYLKGIEQRQLGNVDVTSANLRAMLLVTTTSTPDNPDHVSVNDIVSDEGSNASRITLTGGTVTMDTTNNRVEITWANMDFGSPAAGETAVYLVLYLEGASDSLRYLLWGFDITDYPYDGNSLQFASDAEGAVRISGS